MDSDKMTEPESHLDVVECQKGEFLLWQGVHEMEQYFILDGMLKRVVTNQQAKQMIPRFADENDIEIRYAAWRPDQRYFADENNFDPLIKRS